MKIAIIGTRGIPNNYGGFEQFAEYLSQMFEKDGHSVHVYNSHNHPYKEKIWKGVNIIHIYDPEKTIGTAGQFIYDLNCILDLRKRSFDIILQLGYTSSSIWGKILPKKSIIITNMDGLEWKRTKYNALVKKFLKYAEGLAIDTSDVLISDSIGIQSYIKQEYNKKSVYIPYGADVAKDFDINILSEYGLNSHSYDMLIARIEPENSIETILHGFSKTKVNRKFIVVGNVASKYGNYITSKFQDERIMYLGAIYNISRLNTLRYYSNLYLHGHTVGGTNPSLLEAMASGALICSHKNLFNSSILGEDTFYFKDADDITKILSSVIKSQYMDSFILNNFLKIKTTYSWAKIYEQYYAVFKDAILNNQD